MGLAYLEEYMDTLVAVRQHVQSVMTRVAELDSHAPDNRSALAAAIQDFQANPTSPEGRTALQAAVLNEVSVSAEKKSLIDSLLRTLGKQCQALEDDLQGFQEEVRMNTHDKRGRTEKKEECVCSGKGRGEMVGCENPYCPSEWFHLHCVGLNKVPAGKWFCPECLKK